MRYSVILASPHAWFFFWGGEGEINQTILLCHVSLIMVTLNSAVLKSKFSFIIHVGGRN